MSSNPKEHPWFQVNKLSEEIKHLEAKIIELEAKLDKQIQIQRNHLIRVKNKEYVSDDLLLYGRQYQDLSPEKAWELYKRNDFDFILIDVSGKDYIPQERLPEAIHIPWEEFTDRFPEISSHATPILVISEDGINSIKACELLAKHGYYNCSNISGGYKFWQGFRLKSVQSESA